jgi:uncharacterized membrane protein
MSKKTYLFFAIALLGAALGLFYSGYSTSDFVAHLDRQLHPVSCSLLPGLTETTMLEQGAEGCKVAMFSPYSSFWRDRYWGGVPWSLFAVGLFGFGLALSLWGIVSRKGHHLAVNIGLLLVAIFAVGASLAFFSISVSKLHEFCKTCVGTYIASGILALGAALVFVSSIGDRRRSADAGDKPSGTANIIAILVVLAEMGLATLLPVGLFLKTVPDYTKYISECGTLKSKEDKNNVLIPIGKPAAQAGTESILVVDPLCPACAAFHKRIQDAPFASKMSFKVAILPLDSECNWMMTDSMHPGACVLAKAMICAKDKASEILDWSYANQKEFRPKDKADNPSARIRDAVLKTYPQVKDCLDSPDTKIALNKTLNWAVDQSLPVLTPQLYVNGARLCDEDTDLGLDYAMTRLLGTK